MRADIIDYKRIAKLAGGIYLALLITGIYAHVYIPKQIFVRGDIEATRNNILSNEFLFRSCVVAGMVEAILLLFLAFTLYSLFKQVNKSISRVMVATAILQIPVAIILASLKLTALTIVKGEGLNTFPAEQLPQLGMVFLDTVMLGSVTTELFTGIWLASFGLLAYRSRFIPILFGMMVIAAGGSYMIDSLITILFPGGEGFTRIIAYIASGIAQISIMLWFLIKGLKEHISIQVISESIISESPFMPERTIIMKEE